MVSAAGAGTDIVERPATLCILSSKPERACMLIHTAYILICRMTIAPYIAPYIYANLLLTILSSVYPERILLTL